MTRLYINRILILLLCCSFLRAGAVTYVSGIISSNTTWTKANSPYIVNGNLSVDSAVTLTIEPGVTVRVDSVYFFYVDGRLLAEGTATDTISFTANSVNPSKHNWAGITFRLKSKNDTSRISYCRFEYSYTALLNQGTSLYIYNSVFRYNYTAIRLLGQSPVANYHTIINKCLVTQNEIGVLNSGNSTVLGEFTENELSLNDEGYRRDAGGAEMLMTDNSFNYNRVGAQISNGPVRGMTSNTFKGNTDIGLFVLSTNLTTPISDNLFIYNNVALSLNDVMAGSVTNNTIAYNETGIEHTQYVVNYPNSSAMAVSYNCFSNNTLYNYKEKCSVDFELKNNWWGTTSTPGIDSTIDDYYDNFSSGKITYTPILTGPSGCMSADPPPQCVSLNSVVAAMDSASTTTATATWPVVASAPAYEYEVTYLSSGLTFASGATTATSISLSGLSTGQTYSVCVRALCAASPFQSAWVCDTLKGDTVTRINTEPAAKAVRIFPNPSNGTFTLQFNNTVKNAGVQVYDMMGREVYPSAVVKQGTQITLNVPKGIYIVKLKMDDTVLTNRVIVE